MHSSSSQLVLSQHDLTVFHKASSGEPCKNYLMIEEDQRVPTTEH